MPDLLNGVRTEFRNLQLHEVLHEAPRALLGVTPAAEAALLKLEIGTVFDLATSTVFEGASRIVSAGTDLRSALAQHGAPTADLVREVQSAGKKIDELQFLPISVLEAIPADVVDEVAAALDAQTVRDLALYPPFQWAHALLTALYFPENAPDFDPERPTDLVPRSGEYPTERVQYTTLLMDAISSPDGVPLVNIASPDFTPLDLAALAAGDSGFKTVAFGALLTFNQLWYAQGVTLGQLLHSTALAPGESTRIAVVDWSRRSRAGETEVIDELDDLANDTTHNRAISEVTNAVASEAQSGFSHAATTSTTHQDGTASAAELSAPLGGLFGGPSGSIGHTSSDATGASTADGYSSSFGQRNVASSMMQNVNDRTHQHAHSSRSRRASVIKEVSQSEHENVSTRVLANYNHMHALTIQYYEVVQIHRVDVALAKAERVVFIPVALANFNDDTLVRRFQAVLARAALTFEARETLNNLDVIEIAPDRQTRFSVLETGIADFVRSALTAGPAMTEVRAAALRTAAVASAEPTTAVSAAPEAAAAGLQTRSLTVAQQIATGPTPRISAATARPLVQRVNDGLWTSTQTARLSGLLNRAVLRFNSTSLFLPTDVSVEGVVVSAGGAPIAVVFHLLGGGTDTSVSPTDPLALSDVVRISVSGSAPDREVAATITLTVNRNGVRFPLELPTVQIAKGATGETRLVTVDPGGVSANVKQHLMSNRLHYSQAVLRSLDAAQIALLLAGFSITIGNETVPVAQVVEPLPVRYVGNYLAFKLNVDPETDDTWSDWLRDHGVVVGSSKQDLVPLGTGGTFAEAVLGRSNSAEKLDLTRFWDWQDSPTPLQPTEIAAVSTGSRATSEDVKPGQLSTPIVNITSPTSLPDPTGTAAVLAAIQNGSMFRDMSGLQATIGLAQAALQSTAAGASTAGQQAGTNMDNLLKANTERQRIAAEMITSLAKTAASAYTGGAVSPGGGISGGGSSQQGAKINYFDKTQAGGSSPAGAVPSGGGGPVAPSGPAGGSGGGGTGGSGLGSPTPAASEGNGWSTNPAALAATWGDSQPPAALFDKVLAKVPVDAGTDAGGGVPDAGSVPPPVPPFSSTTSVELATNIKLQTALDSAVAALESKKAMTPGSLPVAFTFADISGAGGGALPSAGWRETDVNYIASEAKVPVMYAAYALRDMVNRFAATSGASTATDLFAQVGATMNPSIRSAVPRVAAAPGITDAHRLPSYAAMFTTSSSGGHLRVDFTPGYLKSLEDMIVPSDNGAAAACIHGLGYGYLNGSLAAAGLFDGASDTGLWVGGDFQMGAVWPYVRIPSRNDGPSAQAGTTRHMVRLVASIATNHSIDSGSSGDMLSRLHRAAIGPDTPWASRAGVLKAGCITHNKLGLGPAQGGSRRPERGQRAQRAGQAREELRAGLAQPRRPQPAHLRRHRHGRPRHCHRLRGVRNRPPFLAGSAAHLRSDEGANFVVAGRRIPEFGRVAAALRADVGRPISIRAGTMDAGDLQSRTAAAIRQSPSSSRGRAIRRKEQQTGGAAPADKKTKQKKQQRAGRGRARSSAADVDFPAICLRRHSSDSTSHDPKRASGDAALAR